MGGERKEGDAAGLPTSGADAGKDAKIKALEEQMVANAKGFAAQISEYVLVMSWVFFLWLLQLFLVVVA